MNSTHTLWYGAPAAAWTQALPLGNGRLGAMVFGGPLESRFQLNEDSLWSGLPHAYTVPGAKEALARARALLAENRYLEAQEALETGFAGPDCQSYLPMGDLTVRIAGEQVENYIRSLDLETGIARAEYSLDGQRVVQECFISHPDQALALEITSQAPLNLEIALTSPLKSRTYAHRDVIMLDGLCPNDNVPEGMSPDDPSLCPEEKEEQGIGFRTMAAVVTDAHGEVEDKGEVLCVRKATRVSLFLVARSSYNGFDKHPQLEGRDTAADCALDMARVRRLDYPAIRERHVADFSTYMRRVDFCLDGEKQDALPTNERLQRFARTGQDAGLIELIFQFGRYLMVAASRSGTHATNLQGIWNDNVRPPWRSDYTVNINTEMNYWPAEPLGLAENTRSRVNMLSALRETGAQAAHDWYGARGMVAHHNVDIWAHATPVGAGRRGIARWSFWPMSAAWMSRHLCDHYLYSLDLDFLQETALPILRECAQFFADTLQEDENGYVCVSPATSPENVFSVQGKECGVAKSAAMSDAIVRELFTNYLRATEVLHIEEPLRAKVKALLPRVKPYAIGSKGQLLEWDQEYEECEPTHRHCSHLYGLHPAHEITPDGTPELAKAARRSLELRGDEGTGWSLGWKINFWARLGEGDHALKLLKMQLRPVTDNGVVYVRGGGTYENLFDAHPPFQIDGNFGAAAGIGEMLVQSRPDALLLAPALPDAWTDFSLRGMRAMHAMEVDLTAKGGALRATVRVERRCESPVAVFLLGLCVGEIQSAGEYHFGYEPF